RRPDVQLSPDQHRRVEALPALLPVLGHLLPADAHAHPGHLGLPERKRRQLAGRAVERVLDPALAVHLLDARGRQLEQRRQHGLGRLRGRPDGQPDQLSARFTRANSDSSASFCRFSSPSDAENCLSRSRCSWVSLRGITTLTTTRWSPRRPRRSDGMPLPRRISTEPGCVPGSISTSSSPSSVGTVILVPSAASGAARSMTVTRSLPSRTKRSSGATRTTT